MRNEKGTAWESENRGLKYSSEHVEGCTNHDTGNLATRGSVV